MAKKTANKMVKTSGEYCKKCKYAYTGGAGSVKSCDYLLMTGKLRDCEVGYCDKFEKKTGRRKQSVVLPMPRK